MRGNSPRCAMARGSSPCRRIQPLRAPKLLIEAKMASSLPAPPPQNCVAKSTNGAFDLASVAGGTSSNTVVQASAQISAVTTVPKRVAMGMVRAGFATLSAGMDADSNPNSAHSVRVAAEVMPLRDSGMLVAAATSLERSENNPKTATPINGKIFSTVVMLCTQPEAFIPYQFTKVSIHRRNRVTAADAPGFSAIHGSSGERL